MSIADPKVDIKTLTKFKKFLITIGNIPTSYLESMTYYEMLTWLCNYLQNTVIPAVNNNAEAVEELQDLFIQLKDYVDNYFTQEETIEKIKLLIDTQIEPYITELNEEINLLDNKITQNYNTLTDIINNNYNLQKEYIDSNVANLQYQIDNFSIDNIKMLDPTTGLLTPIEQVIYNIYDSSRTNAITCSEFDAIVDLTCSSFDSKEINAFDFDNNAKALLLA